MRITRTSMVSGITRTRELPVTVPQIRAYMDGALLQDAFPNLSPDDREFIKTGITAEEWNALFNDDDFGGW